MVTSPGAGSWLKFITGMSGHVDAVERPTPQAIIFSGAGLSETSTEGDQWGTLVVIDPGNGPHVWSLIEDVGGVAVVDATTGYVTLPAVTLDFETTPTYVITVRVANKFGRTLDRDITLNVLDFDENLPEAPPENTVAPSINGTTRVDHVLTVSEGTWTGNSIPGYLYQWKRGGVAILNAVARQYLLTAADLAATITCTVTGRNQSGSVDATTAGVGPITASEFIVSRYIAPSALGTQNGSSWANAGGMSKLNQFIGEAGSDGIVYIRSDAGNFGGSRQTITHGGTSGHPVTIRGVNVNLAPTLARCNGGRTDPWVYGATTGNDFILLAAGADHLSFEFLNFTNIGNGCFRIADNIADLNIESCAFDNVQRFVENTISGTATTATATGFTIRNVTGRGFSKGFARIQYNSSNGLIVDCFGDSEEQDGDNFPVGIGLGDTMHDVAVTRCIMMRCVQTQIAGVPLDDTPYWNADGYSTESGCHDITFTDCEAYGCTDGGFDLKGTNINLVRPRAGDNKKNIRLWGTHTITGAFLHDAYKRGGNSAPSSIWVRTGATVTVTDSAVTHLDTAVAFDMEETTAAGSTVFTTVNTSVQVGGEVVGNPLGGAIVTLDTKTPPPNTVLPVISGATVAGSTLSVTNGTWTGAGFSYTYRWKREGRFISEATSNTYVLTSADIGKAITCTVYARTSAGYVGEVTSLAAGSVVGVDASIDGSFISGLPRVGGILTGNAGTVTGFPTPTVTFFWKRDGAAASSGATYSLTNADLGHTISFVAVADNGASSDSYTAAGKLITAAALGLLYIGPSRAGLSDGSSWANRGRLNDLNSFIAGSLAGSTIYLAADLGDYSLGGSNGPSITHGGSGDPLDDTPDLANFIKVQGVNADLTPAMAKLVGNRTDWVNYPAYQANNEVVTSISSWTTGPLGFTLLSGANYLWFDHIRGERIGAGLFYQNPGTDPGGGADWQHHIHLTNIEAFNVQRVHELDHSPLTIRVGYVLMKDWNVIGFSKDCIRPRATGHDWLIQNVVADSGRQDRDNFAVGIQIGDNFQNLEIINCTIKNITDTVSGYWNGDGISAEHSNKNIYFEDVTSSGHTDAGIDTKQAASTADWISGSTSTYRLRAAHSVYVLRGTFSDNKKNLKTWDHVAIQDAVLASAHKRGGDAASCHITMSSDDPGHIVTMTGGSIDGSGSGVVEYLTSQALTVMTGVAINNTGSWRSGSLGYLRLIDCTGNAIPALADYSVPTYRASNSATSDAGSPGPEMPFGKKDDICVVVGCADTIATTIQVVGAYGDVWTHEPQATSGSAFQSRMAWRRLNGTDFGTIRTSGIGAGSALMRLAVSHVFDGCVRSGIPYEGYATSTSSTAPAVVVTDDDRMVAHIHSCSDNNAFGNPPAGYTNAFQTTTSAGADGGTCLDVKANVDTGTAAATTRTISGTPTICHAFALKPAGSSSAFPDATNTGVPSGTSLTSSGPVSVSVSGTTISALNITGNVTVNPGVTNVTIVNCHITTSDFFGVQSDGTGTITVTNCEINGQGAVGGGYGIATEGAVIASGNNIYGFENGITCGSNSTLSGNYIHGLQATGADPHYDGIPLHGGQTNVTISGNTVIGRDNSAVYLTDDFGSISNVTISDNYLGVHLTNPPVYTVYIDGRKAGGTITGISVINNQIEQGVFAYIEVDEASVTTSGNILL